MTGICEVVAVLVLLALGMGAIYAVVVLPDAFAANAEIDRLRAALRQAAELHPSADAQRSARDALAEDDTATGNDHGGDGR